MKKKLKLIKQQLNRIEELLLLRDSDASNQMQDVQYKSDREYNTNEDLWMPQSDLNTGGNCQCK